MATQLPLVGDFLELGEVLVEECRCPVCEQEFVQPKCLPCSHNVCLECLGDLLRHDSRRLECPVDGKRFRVPEDGIDSLPTNNLLVRLMKTLAKKARSDLTKSLKDLKENIDKTKKSRECRESSLDPDTSRAKRKIYQTTDNLRAILDKKESELCKAVEDMAAAKEREAYNVRRSLRKAEQVAEKMEDLLRKNRDPGIILSKRNDFLLAAKMAGDDFNVAAKTEAQRKSLDFIPNIEVHRFLNQNSFGSLESCASKTVMPSKKPFEIPHHLIAKFHPQAIAANATGFVAVVDTGNNCILLYDETGKCLRQIGESGCKLTSPHSIAFLDNSQFVVVDGFGNGFHRLLVYDISGTIVKTLSEVNGANVRFLSVSAEPKGRIIVACNRKKKEYPYCIRVCGRDYKDIQYVATYELKWPSKVLWLAGNIYVLDGYCGNVVKVYDQYGEYVCKLDEASSKGPSLIAKPFKFTSPGMRMAVDSFEEKILVWDKLSKKVRVLQPDGTLVREFSAVPDGIEDMAVTSSGHLAVITAASSGFSLGGKIGDRHSSIQLIPYRKSPSSSR